MNKSIYYISGDSYLNRGFVTFSDRLKTFQFPNSSIVRIGEARLCRGNRPQNFSSCTQSFMSHSLSQSDVGQEAVFQECIPRILSS